MADFWAKLFDADGFVPRRYCGDWSSELVWLHTLSDILIWLAYVSIPVVLVYYVRGRGGLPVRGLVLLFAAFILFCGFVHLSDALMFYQPLYRAQGLMKVATATVSWAAVIALILKAPGAIRQLDALHRSAGEPPPPPPDDAPPLHAYLTAIVAGGLAVVARGMLDPFLGQDHAFVLSLLAVVATAWSSGLRPALVTLAVSVTGITYFYVLPRWSFDEIRTGDQTAVGLTVFCGVGAAMLGEGQLRARRAAKDRESDLRAAIDRLAASERQVRESETQFRRLADSMPQIVFAARPDGHVDYFNRRWYDYTGLADQGRTGDASWVSVHEPDSLARVQDAWHRAVATGEEYQVEYRLRRADGTFRWHLGRAVPVRDNEGKIIRWYGTNTDIHDAKLAVEAVERNESRFRTLTEAVPHVVWNADAAGSLTYVNTRWTEYTGLPVERATADGWFAVMHPDDRNRIRRNWEDTVRRAAAGDADRFAEEVRIRRQDSDDYRWFLTVAMPHRRADGTVDQWIGSMADIHDQKTAAEAVAASEARFRSLTETIPQMVWTAEPDRTVTFLNHRWTEYTGTDIVTRIGRDDLIHPDDAAPMRAEWTRVAAEGRDRFTAEFRLRRAGDGEYRWMLNVAVPTRDAAGRIVQWVGSVTDIHDQKRLAEILEEQVRERTAALTEAVSQLSDEVRTRTRAEAALAEQQNFLDAILENVADGIVACDGDGKLKLFNAASRQFHGLPPEPIPRERWAERYHLFGADGRTPLAPAEIPLARALAGERVRDAEMVIRADGQADRFLLASGQPLTDAAGRNLGAVVSMRDITERRTSEVRLREFAEALQASNRELEQFASVASHDLQEPLRKIQAFGDRLATRNREHLGEQGKEYLDRMLASAGRMRKLIDDLLAFSRISVKPRQPQPVNLDAVAQEVLSDLDERLSQSGGRVEIGPLPTIPADPTHMRQLFQNLIGNGLKFARPGVPPVVGVTAVATPTGVRLLVADNGIGFEEKYTDRLFQVFQRLHGKEEYEGTGVGLAICRKIVERMGGTITARSTPGQGAVFQVDLPTAPVGDRAP